MNYWCCITPLTLLLPSSTCKEMNADLYHKKGHFIEQQTHYNDNNNCWRIVKTFDDIKIQHATKASTKCKYELPVETGLIKDTASDCTQLHKSKDVIGRSNTYSRILNDMYTRTSTSIMTNTILPVQKEQFMFFVILECCRQKKILTNVIFLQCMRVKIMYWRVKIIILHVLR